jgi:hypothetical protein
MESASCSSSARDVLELDRKVGEAIDIYVNNRLVARARWCWEEKLGVTMTEVIKAEGTEGERLGITMRCS